MCAKQPRTLIEPGLALSRARGSLQNLLAVLHVDDESVIDTCVAPIARSVAQRVSAAAGAQVVGLSGAQGTGKSTLAALVRVLLTQGYGLRAVVLSLDDYYLPRAERRLLGEQVHPLLVTRGVPGTHDVSALRAALGRLRSAGEGEPVELLRFSKAHDDREQALHCVVGAFDVVLFEGWCVGARPEPERALQVPVNALERDEDRDCRYRRYVNRQLAGPYRALWARLDMLVFLAAPDLDAVRAFRREQESKLRASTPGASAVMSDAQLLRFIEHFERVTRTMLQDLPQIADVVVELDRTRGVSLSTKT